jgi:GntR family transcriptional regulator, transcriptional repressor for pyruvate dehydrogenase complex
MAALESARRDKPKSKRRVTARGRAVAHEFKPVRTRHTFEEAVEQISAAIRAGIFRAGDRLPSERILAQEMDISRPTVREALRVFSEAGVVEIQPGPGGGASVINDVVPLSLIREWQELRINEVSAVLEARRVLEPRVAQLASLYGTEDDFDRLAQIIDRQREAGVQSELLGQLDELFHLAMAEATHNAEIVNLMRTLLDKLVIAWDMDYRREPDPTRGVKAHEDTLRAIVGGDHEEIERVMDAHLSILEHQWEEGSGRRRLREVPPFLRSNSA